MKSDFRLQQNILRELRCDHRVRESEIGVEVEQGIVVLTGTVASHASATAVLEIACRVMGVLDVINEIVVRIPDTSMIADTDIAAAIEDELRGNAFLPHEQIQSTVAQGWVMLTGTVEIIGQREEAEETIRALEGVRGVTNDIVVAKRDTSPLVIRSAIARAIEHAGWRDTWRQVLPLDDGAVRRMGPGGSWRGRAS